MLYYANKEIHIIFADGSNVAWQDGESGIIGGMTWEYFQLSGFNNIFQRLVEASRRVKTEFVFLLDDEDCILWSGIEQSTCFLEQNLDHSCAGGRIDGLALRSQLFVISQWHWWGLEFSLLQNRAIDRFESVLHEVRTLNLLFQVFRSKDLNRFVKNNQNVTLEGKWSGFFEVTLVCFLTLTGKWKMGSYPYLVRFRSLAPHVWFRRPTGMSYGDSVEIESIVLRAIEEKASDGSMSINAGGKYPISEICWKHAQSVSPESSDSLEISKSPQKKIEKENLKSALKILKAKFFSSCANHLWRFAPFVYKLVNPDYSSRVHQYAHRYRSSSANTYGDIVFFHSIWSTYPDGLTKDQLELELAKM